MVAKVTEIHASGFHVLWICLEYRVMFPMSNNDEDLYVRISKSPAELTMQ